MKFLNKLLSPVRSAFRQNILGLLIVSLTMMCILVLLWSRIVLVVPGGSLAVLYKPLAGGIDLQNQYREGVHFIFPLNSATIYDARVQTHKVELELLTADQLETQVTTTFQYEINPNTVALLHKYAGPDYLQKIIIPQVVSIVRELVAKYSSKTVYTGGLQDVISDIAITADSIIIDELSPPGFSNVRLIRINSVQLASITFPPEIRKAILNKMTEQQNAEAMIFKIEAASLEAERKVIEAKGIMQFQDIAFKGEIESYLRYRGIEATESLAKSDNAKVMLFGSGSSGLPLVLGDITAKQSSILK